MEDGEGCLKAHNNKVFASSVHDDNNDNGNDNDAEPRFLYDCAGSLLVQRLERRVCDAWMADSILTEGGTGGLPIRNCQVVPASELVRSLVS